MADTTRSQQSEDTVTVPRITIPEYVEPTAEDLARRREFMAAADRIRARSRPASPGELSAVELIDADFYDIEPNGH